MSKNGCPKTKGCFSKPSSCSSSEDCDFLITYTPSDEAVVFEMSSKGKWAALGFNKEGQMVRRRLCKLDSKYIIYM